MFDTNERINGWKVKGEISVIQTRTQKEDKGNVERRTTRFRSALQTRS